MKQFVIILFLLSIIFFSCKKEKIEPEPTTPVYEQYVQFIGDYKVYDTIGTYLYDMSMVHYFSGYNVYGNYADSLLLQNYADTFDIKYQFMTTVNQNTFSIGIYDSIVDKNNKSWSLSGLGDIPSTGVVENQLFNDTIIFYFQQSNIQYYILEAQPYFFCKCKHVAVKQ